MAGRAKTWRLTPVSASVTEYRTMATATFHTITLDRACLAVKVYNEGLYGVLKNADLDDRGRDMFANGLGSTLETVERQVEFIGRDYGGAAGFKAAYALIPAIARDIFSNRDQYEQAAVSALPILQQIPSRNTIEILYRPFVKPLHGKINWQVWATKFWHFLNPNAFPIEDSRVDKFFLLNDSNSVDKYLRFLNKFRDFALTHADWLPHLRTIDGHADKEPCPDNKLWDKMCYGLGDLDKAGN